MLKNGESILHYHPRKDTLAVHYMRSSRGEPIIRCAKTFRHHCNQPAIGGWLVVIPLQHAADGYAVRRHHEPNACCLRLCQLGKEASEADF